MRFSVVIPVYNVESFLRECVDCVLAQSFTDTEIVLVDDGSTDSSPVICREYADRYPNVAVVTKTNGGLSSARNAGIQHASGDYVMFLDSDDYWSHGDVLSALAKIAVDAPDLICFGYREYVDKIGDNGIGIDFSAYRSQGESKNEVLRAMLCNGAYVSSACCKAVKLDVIKKNSLYFREGITSEDIDWSARLLKCVGSIAVYPESFYCYRQRRESIVHNIRYENLEILSDNILRCVELGEDIAPGEFRELYFNYVSYQYITFLKVAPDCESDERTKPLVKKMKEYRWLLNYHLIEKVKFVYLFKKLIGFNLMYRLLKFYTYISE